MKHFHLFFRTLSGKLVKIWRTFFGTICQKNNQCLQRSFRRKRQLLSKTLSISAYTFNMSVSFAFYVGRGTYWWKKCLNHFIISYHFSSRQLFRFPVKFLPAELPNKQSLLPELLPQERVFLRKLVVCTPNIRVWAEPFCILSTFVKVVEIAFWVSRETNQRKTVRLSRKKFNFVFRFWVTKCPFWEINWQFCMKCLVRLRRNLF